MAKKILIIIKELGRIKSRLNTPNHNHRDAELVDKIAELIAEYHTNKF